MNLFLLGIGIFVIIYLFLNWFAQSSSKKIVENRLKFVSKMLSVVELSLRDMQ